jgi:hypothetical protein
MRAVCVTMLSVCVAVLESQQYIEPSQPNMASKYLPSLTLHILDFKIVALHCDVVLKESYGCINDPK